METLELDELRKRSNIISAAKQLLATEVRQRRDTAWALCPFHSEKTPSLKLDSATGLYYCFGCGQAGNIFQFVMALKDLSFDDAVRWVVEHG